jgi:hypothetical protein
MERNLGLQMKGTLGIGSGIIWRRTMKYICKELRE